MVFKLWNQWRRFWRLAEMRLLFLALSVAVMAVTSVGFFTDRAERAMTAQATQLLGADLVIVSTRPLSPQYLKEAQDKGLRTAQTISFPSMVSRGEQFQLTQVKAVSPDYPLHGVIETKGEADQTPQVTPLGSLHANEVLAESRLLTALGVKPGALVQLGHSQVRLAKIIHKMPDQASNAFQLAPKLLLPLDSLAETGLLTPASRASYQYLFAGTESQLKPFKKWLKTQLLPQERLRTLDDGLPAVQQALQRGQRFLKMAALLAVILAGAGIALSSYSLTQHETPAVAVIKTLGASRKQILFHYLSQLLLAATLAAFVGSVFGYLLQMVLANYLQDFIGGALPEPGWSPLILGFITAWIMVMGFSLVQLLQLIQTTPVQILQQQTTTQKGSIWTSVLLFGSAVLLLMWMQTQDWVLSLLLLLAVLLAIILFWVAAILLLYLLRRLSTSWRLPKANYRMVWMIVVFGIGLFSLFLLTTLRSDLINRWQSSLPADAPNHFLINIQPDEAQSLKTLLTNQQITAPFYPMTLGRLVKINDKAISPDDLVYASNERARRLVIREFNLSTAKKLPEANQLVQGKWFDKDEVKGFSVEEGIAKTLGLKLGDTLTFDIAGQAITEPITSLRRVKWDSMKPNFFVLTAPQVLADKPKTFITSVHLSVAQTPILGSLIQQYPSVTDIDISAILNQVRELINKAALAVQVIFIFTLIAGLVVLYSALQSQKALRRREIAILKTMGASRSYLQRNLIMEFVLIGALAGFLAATLAIVMANIAAYQLFDLSPEINLSLLISGTLIGATLVGFAGYLNVRGLLSVLPVSLFR